MADKPRPGAPRANQFSTVHALRGIAALWVVLFHSYKFGSLNSLQLDPSAPLTRYLFEYGRGGVAMFFVISGFVIAHSLRDAQPNGRFIGRFMLRRSIRLDPPYWLSILVVLGFAWIVAAQNGRPAPWPGIGSILAHMAYLQEFLRIPAIQVVYWTLTYEIQFYFVYVLALWAHRAMSAQPIANVEYVVPATMIGLAFIAAFHTSEWALHGLFLNYWHTFVAGVLAYYGGYRRIRAAGFLLLGLAIIILVRAPETAEVFNSPAAVTALGLYLAGQTQGLLMRLRSPPLQFLGTISYSLYLLHIPAILGAVSISLKLVEYGSVSAALVIFGSTIAASLCVAALFWYAVERPSHRLARSLKPRKAPAAEPQLAGT